MSNKNFIIEPEANNSVTLWIQHRPVKAIADRRNLIIVFDPKEWTAELTENGVRINRKKNHPEVTIEEMSGSIDFGGQVDYTRLCE
jgi:hypothetical protein